MDTFITAELSENKVNMKPRNDFEALVLVLELSVTAPTEKGRQGLIDYAVEVSRDMAELDVSRACRQAEGNTKNLFLTLLKYPIRDRDSAISTKYVYGCIRDILDLSSEWDLTCETDHIANLLSELIDELERQYTTDTGLNIAIPF